jgi:hypothetical protein
LQSELDEMLTSGGERDILVASGRAKIDFK